MLNKKMLLSLLVIGVVSVTAGAGTWAYFSDTETSSGNTFTAGTLDLLVNGINLDDYPESETTYYNEADLYPGWISTDIVTLKNDGSIPGVLSMDINDVLDYENLIVEAEKSDDSTQDGELSDNMHIKIQECDASGNVVSTSAAYGDNVLSVLDDSTINLGMLDAKETRYVLLTGSIAESVNNVIQSDSVTFNIVLTLEQDANKNGLADPAMPV